MVTKYNWDIKIAYAVCMGESKGNQFAANRTDVHKDANGNVICVGSFGLMQISCHSGEVYDPDANMAIAWEKYKARGWQPWGAYTDGRYLEYMQ